MDIKADIERVRNLMYTLQNWDAVVQEKQYYAEWGNHDGHENTKVQGTRRTDRQEKAILEVQELEEQREVVFTQYWEAKEAVLRVIEKYASMSDLTILYRYTIGMPLSEIPLKGKSQKPQTVVNAAIKRLQATIDRGEEIMRHSQAIQDMIRGGKKKCKHCEAGFIQFKKEESDRFIFVCDGCGIRLRADKKGKQNNIREEETK